ncbi:MAG TPA: hypothetical protein VJ743_19895 [Albitalea sp.]|nr:hypothetical protein [Albitalea sp.]
MRSTRDHFYGRWILANALAEGLGLGSTLLIGHYVIGGLHATRPGAGAVLLGAVLAVAMGTVLEGALVGYMQGRVLTRREPRVTLGQWTLATSVGAGLAWTLGMLPSTLAGLLAAPPIDAIAAAEPAGPPLWIVLPMALAMGALLGPLLALMQWRLLRQVARHAARWLAANAAAWGLGMLVVFAGMAALSWSGSSARTAGAVFVVCSLAGAVVGAVHGRVLLRLLSQRGAAHGPSMPRSRH